MDSINWKKGNAGNQTRASWVCFPMCYATHPSPFVHHFISLDSHLIWPISSWTRIAASTFEVSAKASGVANRSTRSRKSMKLFNWWSSSKTQGTSGYDKIAAIWGSNPGKSMGREWESVKLSVYKALGMFSLNGPSPASFWFIFIFLQCLSIENL